MKIAMIKAVMEFKRLSLGLLKFILLILLNEIVKFKNEILTY